MGVTIDPRGTCLPRCSDWNELNQAVVCLWVTLNSKTDCRPTRYPPKFGLEPFGGPTPNFRRSMH